MLATAEHGTWDWRRQGQDLQVMLCHGQRSQEGIELAEAALSEPSCKHGAFWVKWEALPNPWSLFSCPRLTSFIAGLLLPQHLSLPSDHLGSPLLHWKTALVPQDLRREANSLIRTWNKSNSVSRMLAQEKERKKKNQCSLSMGLLESPRPEGPEQGFHAPEMHPRPVVQWLC